MSKVWDWVHDLLYALDDAGEQAVADAVLNIGTYANDRDYEQLEAVYPVLLGYARANELPWLEVYARHWRLQAYLHGGQRLQEMLPEAVSLIARTAREDARDCPQRRCAVQDISIAYAAVDAPGYAAERLAAVSETAAEIDPSYSCSGCLMSEAVEALCSLNRHAEALRLGFDWLERARAEPEFRYTEVHFWSNQARGIFDAAIAIGDLAAAERILTRAEPETEEDHLWKAMAQARFELARGDSAAAAEHLPQMMEPRYGLLRPRWLEVATVLALGRAIANDAELGAQAKSVLETAEANGLWRHAFNAACNGAELALARGRPAAAALRLQDGARLRAHLRGSHGADERLAALQTRAAQTAPAGGSDAEAALDAALAAGDAAAGAIALAKLNEASERWARLAAPA